MTLKVTLPPKRNLLLSLKTYKFKHSEESSENGGQT